jgi:hypothetical protein
MTTVQLLDSLKKQELVFTDVITHIESLYQHVPTAFINGNQRNEENQNQGSAKVLFFANLQGLSKEDTLFLFAEHYQSVLNTPEGIDHQNIRQFMLNGWDGVAFEGKALLTK